MNESDIRRRINEVIAAGDYISSLKLAKEMRVPEVTVIRNLPEGNMIELSATRFREILNEVSNWGRVTVVVRSPTFIGEFKVSLPKGESGENFYNLWSEDFTCHIREEEVGSIFFVTQPLMERESRSIQFFDVNGDVMFKVFLPKDKEGKMASDQAKAFDNLVQGM